MKKVTSRDGTSIALDRSGEGPALVLVTGAFATRSDATSLAANLAPYFTVFAYDRRGRGDSGDTPPYAVEREVEDIEAVIAEAGEPGFVFGHSSGAVLALEAARLLPGRIRKLALYEPPFILDDSRPPLPADYVARLAELAASGRRAEAVVYYMTEAMRIPPEGIAQMQTTPMWPSLESVAHTLAYDGAIMGDTMSGKPASIRRWSAVTVPTLVMDGGNSPAFMHHGAEELTRVLPHAQHRRFPGQEHGVADEVLVPALVEFFKA